MKMRRFENDEWWREIGREAAIVTLRFGKHGKAGIEQATQFPDEAQAIASYDGKIASHLRKGYVEIEESVAAERRKAAGAPMRLGTTTSAAEAEAEATRERLREERATKAREREREKLETKPNDAKMRLEARMAERRAREEARKASRTDTWPSPPVLFERVATGEKWGVLVSGVRVFVTPTLGKHIEIRMFPDEAAAHAEKDRLVDDVRRRGFVSHVPMPEAPGVAIAPRRSVPRILDAASAFAIVRTAFRSGMQTTTRGFHWRSGPALARLMDESEAEPLDRDDEAATAAMLSHVRPNDERSHEALVDFWIARSGTRAALDALLTHARLVVHVDRHAEARTTAGDGGDWTLRFTMWRRLRDSLAANVGPRDEARAAARNMLAQGALPVRCATALAFPNETSLVSALLDEVCAMVEVPWYAAVLLACAPSDQQARVIVEKLRTADLWRCARHLDDLVDTLGERSLDALSFLLRRAREGHDSVSFASGGRRLPRRETAAAIGRIDSDEAAALVEDGLDDRELWPGLVTSALLRPSRFVDRIAPAAASGGTTGALATSLLTWMLRKEPSLRAKAPGVGARRALRIAAARAKGSEERETEAIPGALLSPPWRLPAPHILRPSAMLERIDVQPTMAWPDGVREAWSSRGPHILGAMRPIERDAHCEERFDAARETQETCDARLLVEASPSIAIAAWQEIRPEQWRFDARALRAFVAKHDLAALRGLLAFARARPFEACAFMLPFRSLELSELAAQALDNPDSHEDARAWLLAHAELAAIALVPIAAGPPGVARDHADLAIHALNRHRDVVLDVADRHGVRPLITHLLDHDPKRRPPLAAPVLFDFWNAELLPAPIVRATGRALPLSAIDALGEAIVLDRPELDELRADLDAESLADFARELAIRWMAAGSELDDIGALRAIARFGDDDGARMVAELARTADDYADLPRAREALRTLSTLASKIAILHLAVLARRAHTPGVRDEATRALVLLAHGDDIEAFIDANVPDLGLRADGSLALDTGANVYRVGFDEHLEPFVLDPSGARVEVLPANEGDPEKAADAELAWRSLKRDVSALATVTLDRLEEAMLSRRAIEVASFLANFRDHPLLRHLARRLIWQTDTGATFRVAEDGTLADVMDERYELVARDVRVVLPIDLSDEERRRWTERLSDYEIVQPFLQLARPTP